MKFFVTFTQHVETGFTIIPKHKNNQWVWLNYYTVETNMSYAKNRA